MQKSNYLVIYILDASSWDSKDIDHQLKYEWFCFGMT